MLPLRTVEHAGSESEIKTQGTWGKPCFTLRFSLFQHCLQHGDGNNFMGKKGTHESCTVGAGLLQDLSVLHRHHSWDTEHRVGDAGAGTDQHLLLE